MPETKHVVISVPQATNRRPAQHGCERYAWVILFCCFFIMFLTNLIWASYGVYILEFMDHFPRYKDRFAWMYAANVAIAGLTGVIAGPMVRLLNPRLVALTGSLLLGCGYFICAHSANIWLLFSSFAILIGVALCLNNMATNVATQEYFSKRRAFANGILLTGSSLSIFVAPPVVNFLIETYGWRGAFLLQGGACLHAIPASLLLRPFPRTPAPSPDDEKDQAHHGDDSKVKHLVRLVSGLCACHLLANVPFLLIELSSIFLFLGMHTPIIFTVARAVQFGLSRQRASLVMSSWAITCMCGQVVLGWVGDRLRRGPILCLSLFGAGSILLLSNALATFPLQLTYSGIYGLMFAAYSSVKIPTLVDILGIENLAAAQGINLFLAGIGGLVGPLVASEIAERSGSYVVSFSTAGVFIILSGALMAVAISYDSCQRRFKRSKRAKDAATTPGAIYSPVNVPHKKDLLAADHAFIAASISSLNMC